MVSQSLKRPVKMELYAMVSRDAWTRLSSDLRRDGTETAGNVAEADHGRTAIVS